MLKLTVSCRYGNVESMTTKCRIEAFVATFEAIANITFEAMFDFENGHREETRWLKYDGLMSLVILQIKAKHICRSNEMSNI